MEYDNDSPRPGTHKIEVLCWILLILIGPLMNGLGAASQRLTDWAALAGGSLLLLPLYILFSRQVIPRFLFGRRIKIFLGLSVAVMIVAYVLLSAYYPLARLIAPANSLLTGRTTVSMIRDSFWIVLNMGMAMLIAYLRLRLDEQETVASLQSENLFFKLRYFRSQLNPHFLFNALNSIYSLSLNKKEQVPEVIVRLSDIMRFLLYECNEDKIPLDREVSFIQHYIEIERIRFDADVQFSISGETKGIMIEPFLFISFIENAFKHAIDHSFEKPFIHIALKVSEGQIALNVINNTDLQLEAQAKRINGMGLVNSKSVLELLYPDKYQLDIIQVEKGNRAQSVSRFRNARERLRTLYPDAHTLDLILNNNTFTVSLILNNLLDKVHHHRR